MDGVSVRCKIYYSTDPGTSSVKVKYCVNHEDNPKPVDKWNGFGCGDDSEPTLIAKLKEKGVGAGGLFGALLYTPRLRLAQFYCALATLRINAVFPCFSQVQTALAPPRPAVELTWTPIASQVRAARARERTARTEPATRPAVCG